MDTAFTIRQLLDRYLIYNSYPNDPMDNLIGNRAISAFLISLLEEKKPEKSGTLPGTTIPLPDATYFDKETFLTLYQEYQLLKKKKKSVRPCTYVR